MSLLERCPKLMPMTPRSIVEQVFHMSGGSDEEAEDDPAPAPGNAGPAVTAAAEAAAPSPGAAPAAPGSV
jgi:hypothetical protein